MLITIANDLNIASLTYSNIVTFTWIICVWKLNDHSFQSDWTFHSWNGGGYLTSFHLCFHMSTRNIQWKVIQSKINYIDCTFPSLIVWQWLKLHIHCIHNYLVCYHAEWLSYAFSMQNSNISLLILNGRLFCYSNLCLKK